MSLVLAGAGQEPWDRLHEQLSQLGFSVLPATDVQVVMNLCEHSLPDMAILSDITQTGRIAAAHPRVPLVLATEAELDTGDLLDAMRAGVQDVWHLPMATEDVAERMAALEERRVAVASDNERRLGQFVSELERDQRAGRYIQMGMLPPNPMAIEGFRFQHQILPSLILSGDFVDYFRITDRHFAFYVADVSGHGASSAFVTVLLKNFSRRLRREHRPSMLEEPGEILAWINRELLEHHIDKYVALMLGVGDVETEEIHLVNGGHYPPAIHVSDGEASFIEQRGKPVGLFDEVTYQSRVLHLAPGDRLVMFSDGVIDAMGEGDLASKERRLLEAAAQGGDIDDVWQRLDMDLNIPNRPDDMTCLMVLREV